MRREDRPRITCAASNDGEGVRECAKGMHRARTEFGGELNEETVYGMTSGMKLPIVGRSELSIDYLPICSLFRSANGRILPCLCCTDQPLHRTYGLHCMALQPRNCGYGIVIVRGLVSVVPRLNHTQHTFVHITSICMSAGLYGKIKPRIEANGVFACWAARRTS